MMAPSSIDLLHRCTVKLTVAGRHGTGFFVAPGLILTCAHVVEAAGNTPIKVRWQFQHDFAEAAIVKSLPDIDVALLGYHPPEGIDVPCVLLGTAVQSGDPLYLFGYPDQDFPNGCPATFLGEGFTGDEPPRIKFKLGQVRPGISGSPLLNQRTGRVCGIVKSTRDRGSDLGGGAIPISVVLVHLSELIEVQRRFHQNNRAWLENIRQGQKPHRGKRRSGDRSRRNRIAMIEKVRQIWITDLLNRSHYAEALIGLELVERPIAVERRMDDLVQRSDREDQPLPLGMRLIDMYDTVDRALLILGAPGAGKTTQLLELTRHLLDRAAEDDEHPIPVVFPLSTWGEQQRPVEEWLVDELSQRYLVPREVGQAWVQDDQVLPLLDGLDEVRDRHRAACVEAINSFRQHHGLLPMVVCRRSTDYEAVERKLLLQSAVVIQPLSAQRVETYLQQGGQKLAALRQALQTDPTLWELLDTPLMLQVMILISLDRTNVALPILSTIEERRRYLFDQYVEQMFKRRSRTNRFPDHRQTVHWLTWLAQQMTVHGQTVFHIEHMQPDWLPRLQKWIPTQGISIVLWSALTISIMPLSITPLVFTIKHNGIDLSTTLIGTMLSLEVGILLGLLIHKRDIKSIEKVYWSWTRLKWSALHVRDFFGLTCIALVLIGELSLVILLGVTPYGFFPFTSTFIVPFLLFKGLSFREIEEKSIPNQGIRRSAKNALLYGIVVSITLAVVKATIHLLLELFDPFPGLSTMKNEYLLRSSDNDLPKGDDRVSAYLSIIFLFTSWGYHDLISLYVLY